VQYWLFDVFYYIIVIPMPTPHTYTTVGYRRLEAKLDTSPYDGTYAGALYINGLAATDLHPTPGFNLHRLQVLTLGALGLSEAKTAAMTGRTFKEVENNRQEVFDILGATGMPHAVTAAFSYSVFRRKHIPTLPRTTGRQTDVLCNAALGYDCKETAKALGISESTVKNHRVELYDRIAAPNMAHAVYLGYSCDKLAMPAKQLLPSMRYKTEPAPVR
jgi:DNA-binding CsgD family transcriptional regulator